MKFRMKVKSLQTKFFVMIFEDRKHIARSLHLMENRLIKLHSFFEIF